MRRRGNRKGKSERERKRSRGGESKRKRKGGRIRNIEQTR